MSTLDFFFIAENKLDQLKKKTAFWFFFVDAHICFKPCEAGLLADCALLFWNISLAAVGKVEECDEMKDVA